MRRMLEGIPVLRRLQGLRSLAARLRIRPLIAALRVELDPEVEIEGRIWVPGAGRVFLGRGVRLRGRFAPIELCAHAGAEIRLDDGVTVEGGASIEATERVEVGASAKVGAFAKIMDNHYHHTAGDRKERPRAVPVLIGKEAVISPRAIVLPGARVAARAYVAPGEVLSSRQEAAASRDRSTDTQRVA